MEAILCTDPEKRYTSADIRLHRWFLQVLPVHEADGIVVGLNDIPVDYQILPLLEQFGFKEDIAERNVKANKHNHVTTTYYLMQKKIIRQGGLKDELFRLSPNKSPSLISSQKVSGIKDLVT